VHGVLSIDWNPVKVELLHPAVLLLANPKRVEKPVQLLKPNPG